MDPSIHMNPWSNNHSTSKSDLGIGERGRDGEKKELNRKVKGNHKEVYTMPTVAQSKIWQLKLL